jgi:hypothetical protein
MLMVVCIMSSAWSTTPQQAAARWATFSGNKAARVVYGKAWSSSASRCDSGQVWILDLKAGTTWRIARWNPGITTWGFSCCYRWSPNGRRIFVQGLDSACVLDSNGLNMKTVFRGKQCQDLIWGDWSGNDKVVYSNGVSKVVRTAINADNSAGATEDLVTNKPIGPCWSSVGIDSVFLCYNDIAGNAATGGYHRPMLKNLATGVVKTLIPDNEDECQLVMIPNGLGWTMGQRSSHLVPGSIQDANGNLVETLPRIGSYPQRAFIWSNQLEYFTCQGENSTEKWAWIRSWSKRATSVNMVLSDTGSMFMLYPDLWVEPQTAVGPGSSGERFGGMKNRITIKTLPQLLNRTDVAIYTASGLKVNAQTARKPAPGIYVVKVSGSIQTLHVR